MLRGHWIVNHHINGINFTFEKKRYKINDINYLFMDYEVHVMEIVQTF